MEGIVLETKFSIECQGFMDPEGPLLYEAHSYTGAEATALGNTLQEEGKWCINGRFVGNLPS